MDTEEMYIGGFNSNKIGHGRLMGYGVHATTRRVFGVKSRKGVLAGALLGGGLLGHAIGGALTGQLKAGESAQMIKELEEKKDFEILKQQISEIRLRKPKRWRFKGGYLMIVPKLQSSSGQEFKIVVPGNKEFERLQELMTRFFPEAVKLVD